MARKQKNANAKANNDSATPFDGLRNAAAAVMSIPAAVMAANRPVQDESPAPAAPSPSPVVGARRVYTRKDFASGQWSSGFACSKCGCQDLRVHRTDRRPESSAIVRTRICRNCGEIKMTVEQ